MRESREISFHKYRFHRSTDIHTKKKTKNVIIRRELLPARNAHSQHHKVIISRVNEKAKKDDRKKIETKQTKRKKRYVIIGRCTNGAASAVNCFGFSQLFTVANEKHNHFPIWFFAFFSSFFCHRHRRVKHILISIIRHCLFIFSHSRMHTTTTREKKGRKYSSFCAQSKWVKS